MIKEKLDQLIRESILAKSTLRTEVLRSIKTKFMEWETAKNAKPLDEQAVIRKMISDRSNAAKIYDENGRKDLASKELLEIEHLLEFKEPEFTESDIRFAIKMELEDGNRTLKDIMPRVKLRLPGVDMKLTSQIVQEILGRL